jgi:uncharacterized protein (TIGR04141 family)
MGPTRLPLNLGLLRPGLVPFDAFAKGEASEQLDWYLQTSTGLDPIESTSTDLLGAASDGDVVVCVSDRQSGMPTWQQFVRDSIGVIGFGAGGRTLSAVVFCACGAPDGSVRWIAFMFGRASLSVSRRAIEPRFGLLVSLTRLVRNAVVTGDDEEDDELQGRPRVRQVSFRASGANPFHAGVRAARDTSIDSLRLDRMADFLAAAGGKLETEGEPDQIFGARSLKLRRTVAGTLDLVQIGSLALADYFADDYKSEFGFVDHMVPVVDEVTESVLKTLVLDAILSDSPLVDVLLPDDIVDHGSEQSICYFTKPGERNAQASDRVLCVGGIRGLLDPSTSTSLDQRIRFLDADRNEIASLPIIECLAAQVYCVDRNFLARIDDELRRLPDCSLPMPRYEGRKENEWNTSLRDQDPASFVLLDGKFVRLREETQFEPCDVLGADGYLIHAKRKSRSSAMSHLFVQAERSSELLAGVPDARQQVRTLLTAAANDIGSDVAPFHGLVDRLDRRDPNLTIVLALLGDWNGRDLTALPLLAKITLVSCAQSIARTGFRIEIARVALASNP